MNNDTDDDKLEIPTLTRQTAICLEKVDKRTQPKTDKQLKALEKARKQKEDYAVKRQKEKDEFALFKLMKQKEESAMQEQKQKEESNVSSSEEEINFPKASKGLVKKKKITKKIVPLKKKKKAVKIYLSDSSETDSSSEEEVEQKKPPKRVNRAMQMPIVEEPKIDYRNYFC